MATGSFPYLTIAGWLATACTVPSRSLQLQEIDDAAGSATRDASDVGRDAFRDENDEAARFDAGYGDVQLDSTAEGSAGAAGSSATGGAGGSAGSSGSGGASGAAGVGGAAGKDGGGTTGGTGGRESGATGGADANEGGGATGGTGGKSDATTTGGAGGTGGGGTGGTGGGRDADAGADVDDAKLVDSAGSGDAGTVFFQENFDADIGVFTRDPTVCGTDPPVWSNASGYAHASEPTVGGASRILSPVITVPANLSTVRLRMRHRLNTEIGFDGAQLFVSINGLAVTQVTTFTAGGYTNGGNTDPNSCSVSATGGQYPGWSGSMPEFESEVSLSAAPFNVAPGDTVRIAFRMTADLAITGDGWDIDWVRLEGEGR